MSDRDDIFDLGVRSVLENGEEEIPAGVWDNLAPQLDIIAEERRRKTFLRGLRYVTVTMTAAAAVAIAVLFPWGRPGLPTDNGDKIAVIAPSRDMASEDRLAMISGASLQDEAATVATAKRAIGETRPSEIPSTSAESEGTGNRTVSENPEEMRDKDRADYIPATKKEDAKTESYSDAFFPEEQKQAGNTNISIIMFGNAIGNSKSTKSGYSVTKAPTNLQPESIMELSESSYSIPVSFGIGTRIEFTPRWSMSVGVNYTMISRNFRGIYVDRDMTRHETAIVNTQSYIGIPVNFYYDIYRGSFIDLYTYAGGAMETCVSSKYLLKDIKPDMLKEKVSGLQWSANAGIGVEFILTDWLGLYADPSIRYYFKGNSKSIRSRQQPLTVGFEVGLRVRL